MNNLNIKETIFKFTETCANIRRAQAAADTATGLVGRAFHAQRLQTAKREKEDLMGMLAPLGPEFMEELAKIESALAEMDRVMDTYTSLKTKFDAAWDNLLSRFPSSTHNKTHST